MRFSQLAGKRIAIWGYGREGRSTLAALRRHLPAPDLTVLDDTPLPPEAASSLADGAVEAITGAGARAALARFDVVIKAPGISPYCREVEEARERGTAITSATRIWFAEHKGATTIAVTGTKGKSTTASLVHHLLTAAGVETELVGNIGRPMLDALERRPRVWVMELSSYQTSDLDAAPTVAVLLNLFPEHLDWHGDAETYYRDKLRLFAPPAPRAAVLNRGDPITARLAERLVPDPVYFNDPAGFHVAGGHLCRGAEPLLVAGSIPLPGRHNLENACAALAAVEQVGVDAAACAGALASFRGLPHRLYPLGERGGVLYVDDSISTTPQSTLAAVASFPRRPVTVLLGGLDRGLDYSVLAERLVARPVHAVLTVPQSGPRIAEAVRAARRAAGVRRPRLEEVASLEEAVERARHLTPEGGVVLLSPAAPSYGLFEDFRQRGQVFARAAGFPA